MKDVFRHFKTDSLELKEDRVVEVEKEYPFLFNINVVEFLNDKYETEDKDGFTNWCDIIFKEEKKKVPQDHKKSKETKEQNQKMPDLKAIKAMFQMAINEGIDLENELKGENTPFITLAQAGRILTGMREDSFNFITKAVVDSTKTEKN